MKVYVYKRKTNKNRSRERIATLENVGIVQETKEGFYLFIENQRNFYDKEKFIVSIFGW